MFENIDAKELLADAHAFLSYADTIIEKAVIPDNSAKEIVIAALFSRILSGASAILLLCNERHPIDAEIIIRANLEALFYMGACYQSDEALKNYLGKQIMERKKAINILENDPQFLDIEGRDEVLKDKEFVNSEISKNNIKPLGAEEACKISGFDILYTAYRLHSRVVHADPMYLQETYLGYNEKRIYQINIKPSPKEVLENVLATHNLILLFALPIYRDLFTIPKTEEISLLEAKYTDDPG